jgi:putative transposase
VKFAAIADWADSDSYPVAFMCRELGVSRSGYYAWRSRPPSRRAADDATLIEIMKMVFAPGRGNPGVRRMRAELAAQGHRLSHKRVWRLMKAAAACADATPSRGSGPPSAARLRCRRRT